MKWRCSVLDYYTSKSQSGFGNGCYSAIRESKDEKLEPAFAALIKGCVCPRAVVLTSIVLHPIQLSLNA